MYTDPYSGAGEEFAAALGTWVLCSVVFWLVLTVLFLWLFYRIFQKAGYSGWYTLLNLIPSIGTLIVIFMLALGDWPALKGRGQGYAPPPGGYPGGSGGYIPPSPQQPQYVPPAPPAAQPPAEPPASFTPQPAVQAPVYEPPQVPAAEPAIAPPMYEPPASPPTEAGEEEPPPAPPAPPAE